MKKFFTNSKVLISLIILYPLLFIWQGLDFTDSGYLLTNYQQFFHEPASISASMALWLTNLIGGIWIYFFGDLLGVMGIKLAGVLITYLTVYFAYLILKPYLKKGELLIGLLFSMIFIFRWPIIHYNNLTVLLFISGAYFFLEGLKNSKRHWLYFAGIILGLNIFIRFPNILGFSIILGIFLYGHLNKTPFKMQIKQTFWFFIGYVTAIVLSLSMMKILGHYNFYIESLRTISGMATDQSSMYGFLSLLNRVIIDHIRVFLSLMIITILLFSLLKIYHKIKQRKKALDYLTYILCIFLMLVFMRVVFIGVLYLILLLYLFTFNAEEDNKEFRLVSFMSLIVLLFTQLGSGAGIRIVNYAMWLAVPIAYHYFKKLNENSFSLAKSHDSFRFFSKLKLGQIETCILLKSFLFSFIVFSLVTAYSDTYRDSKNRLAMIYSIKHPLLNGVFTTRDRAEVVQELLDSISKYVKKDDYLIAYEETSMVHFLTKTRPYLWNSWPELYYPPQFKQVLERANHERTDLPVIVRAKAKTASTEWPNKNGLRISKRHIGNRAIMNDFINRYHYLVIWENQFFQILLPPQFKKS